MSKVLLPMFVGVFVGAFMVEMLRRNNPELSDALHAKAKRVECSLSTSDGGIQVRIADDGVGFDADGWTAVPGHLGLLAMRERAEMAGGWLRMTSKPGEGCTVEFWIPDGEAAANAA